VIEVLALETWALGFLQEASGPLIRSSYNADEALRAAQGRR